MAIGPNELFEECTGGDFRKVEKDIDKALKAKNSGFNTEITITYFFPSGWRAEVRRLYISKGWLDLTFNEERGNSYITFHRKRPRI